LGKNTLCFPRSVIRAYQLRAYMNVVPVPTGGACMCKLVSTFAETSPYFRRWQRDNNLVILKALCHVRTIGTKQVDGNCTKHPSGQLMLDGHVDLRDAGSSPAQWGIGHASILGVRCIAYAMNPRLVQIIHDHDYFNSANYDFSSKRIPSTTAGRPSAAVSYQWRRRSCTPRMHLPRIVAILLNQASNILQ